MVLYMVVTEYTMDICINMFKEIKPYKKFNKSVISWFPSFAVQIVKRTMSLAFEKNFHTTRG
jgi:hypothetical protein